MRIVSIDGDLVANRGATGGEAMRLGDMSPYLPMAVIAIEDRRFNSHFGIDPVGLGRAMIANLVSGRLVQGGSTLTQQLAKNLFLEPKRTLGRKIQEAVLALWLETQFSKDEILELYLNRVYFGSGAYGVDAAARRYFNKSAGEVTLAEAALLAGLLKAPSRLSPANDPDAAGERAQTVLAAMRQSGYITDREAARSMSMQAQRAKSYWSGSQHYVADMIMKELPGLVGALDRDIVVETTIDLDLQRHAGKIIAQAIDGNGKRHRVGQGALVCMSGNGEIRALVGGRDYAVSQFNRAADAKRQPGSAFKPFVYLAAIEAGRTPQTVRTDTRVRIGDWVPENHDREYHGDVTLKYALAHSLNTVAAQLVMEVGPRAVTETAHRMGIRSPLQRNASIALGTSEVSLLELTSAYAPFANGGFGVAPSLIRRIRTERGDILYERDPKPGVRVVGARELAMMNDMLTETVRTGTGRSARIAGWEAAGKTGTTQNARDALFVGYTPRLITAVWFGNDDGSPMRGISGGGLPARIWALLMEEAHRRTVPSALPGAANPEIAAVPVFRPRYGDAAPRDGNPPRNGVRPVGELGRTERPRGILDLLFGPAS